MQYKNVSDERLYFEGDEIKPGSLAPAAASQDWIDQHVQDGKLEPVSE